ncbi:MAG: mechanosensitive ion channel protein [Candidatus Glassbacteria bacterium RIFCSPLOWO2_12_FULL_58_11]|uniref:Mechanosensitive ion channel protein n=2 Tax=Candidatus Glassiibacteriota TaxID=1817805 RepID=A0A1F5YJT6_9BACT|nr:MAG: mechanosensitive ion channel protein [Candidatus Glassbacteria bacterium GWA2_58_10]OGG00354.1 MAG: mechanosensitive ion channel protein [Candidatus Glassbacteria bacterium RIFCSPLOWO2_12_FULL_58_11]
MTHTYDWIVNFFTHERILSLIRSGVILAAGLLLARLLAGSIARMLSRYTSQPQQVLLRKIVFYLLAAVVVASSLRELGFQLSVLLGAAGVLTVALGFAAQTSASNIISGLFLLADRPFQIGDVIQVGETTGVVNSIELISVKLRTFQNALVRIPNEELIKSQVINLTSYPIRRIDIEVGVAYKENISRVRELLLEVADRNPLCLEEPAPLFIFKGYGESSLDLLFCVWCAKDNFLQLMNSIQEEIKLAFDKHNIEIPFPQRTLNVGAATEPFAVRLVEKS